MSPTTRCIQQSLHCVWGRRSLLLRTVQHPSQRRASCYYYGTTTNRSPRSHVEKNVDAAVVPVVDLRSDTVTLPTPAMFEAACTAPLGDDVMGEDPTVLELQSYMAALFGKEAGLYVPTGTMSNLVAILAHCDRRASEIIIGANSHIHLWEGGNAANIGGVHTRQVAENPDDATFDYDALRDAFRLDNDDHYAKTSLLCIENTHNMLGGVALAPEYVTELGKMAHEELGIPLHIDGARIFNAFVAAKDNVPMSELCQGADSVSICFSKGLGAPLGSCLVGNTDFIRLAKRARKRCGGGMRQAGVVAAMGLYAVKNNVARLADDHRRARKFADELSHHHFYLPRQGKIDTNIIYFGLPEDAVITKEEFTQRLHSEYNVKLTGGYSKGGKLFRAVTHMGITDEGIDRACEGIIKICTS